VTGAAPAARAPRRAGLRGLSRRTPLSVKLVVATVLLAALGLLAVGFASTTALHSYLLTRVDNQLKTQPAGPGMRFGPDPESEGQAHLSPDFLLGNLGADGSVVGNIYLHPGQTGPRLPALTPATVTRVNGNPFTVDSVGAGNDWRVLVRVDADGHGTHVAALNLKDVDETSHRLILIEAGVSLAVLALLGAGAYAVVRSSLRPLRRVETTAAAIAAGDLTQRVPVEASKRTEVGRLAGALNTMLGQVERAFRDREASEGAARASEDRMRRFVADASHELRTPLTSIRGFAELYRQGALGGPEGVPRMMQRIETEATRMGLLVDDLLLLARLDQQRPLEQRPVDLLEIAGDAVHNARAAAPGHTITLRTSGGEDTDPPVVIGDDARLRQVVTNLMSNAVTHTPPGSSVVLSVRTEGAEAVLEVADDGPGLASDEARQVFERFYRADPSRVRTAGGSGLGLSIVSALVAAHGGRVEVDTAPGAGATFRIRLPLAAVGLPSALMSAPQGASPDEPLLAAPPAADEEAAARTASPGRATATR